MQIRAFVESDRASLTELWRDCGLLRAWNDPDRDIDRKLARDGDLLLVGEDDGKDDAAHGGALVGSVMVGYDGHRGWINYLAVDPACRGRGLARQLMDEAERRLLALGCPKINLQIRDDNAQAIEFYGRLGYEFDKVVSMGKRLIPDEEGP